MKKIQEQLVSLGISAESAAELCQSIAEAVEQHKKKVLRETKAKTDKIVRLCVEEVETYKKRLAEKTEVFLESKSAVIEREKRKQLANEDTEATAKLKNVKNLLEGIDNVFDREGKARLQELSNQNAELRKLTESKDKHLTTLTNTLNQTKRAFASLASENTNLKVRLDEAVKARKVVTESKKPSKPVNKPKNSVNVIAEGMVKQGSNVKSSQVTDDEYIAKLASQLKG